MDTKLSTGYPVAMLRMLVVILAAFTLNVALLAATIHSGTVASWQMTQKIPEKPAGDSSPAYVDCSTCTAEADPEEEGTSCTWACAAHTVIAPASLTQPSIRIATKVRGLLSALSWDGISPPLHERPPRIRTA